MFSDNAFFRAWVANTVWSLSGIWSLDWRGSTRKRALTYAEIRMVACQEGTVSAFSEHYQAFTLDNLIVPTNQKSARRILH